MKPGPAISSFSRSLAEALAQDLGELLGDLPWRRADGAGSEHRRVGGVVAEVGARRALEAEALGGGVAGAQLAGRVGDRRAEGQCRGVACHGPHRTGAAPPEHIVKGSDPLTIEAQWW